jgi:anti-anti-sigma factor
MTDQARFELTVIDGIPVIDASGELDMTNVHDLESRLSEAADLNSGVVVFSLAKVSYFDSRTIHAVAVTAGRLTKNRQQLALVLPGLPSARLIFQMTGLASRLAVFEQREDALVFARTNRVNPLDG